MQYYLVIHNAYHSIKNMTPNMTNGTGTIDITVDTNMTNGTAEFSNGTATINTTTTDMGMNNASAELNTSIPILEGSRRNRSGEYNNTDNSTGGNYTNGTYIMPPTPVVSNNTTMYGCT